MGPGNSGKTTVLDAIGHTLAPRNSVTFDDTDFYAVDPKADPIAITVTIGDKPAEFLKGVKVQPSTSGDGMRPKRGWKMSRMERSRS